MSPCRKGIKKNYTCVYLDNGDSQWKGDGCKTVMNYDGSHTCFCNHTTSFAILLVSRFERKDNDEICLLSQVTSWCPNPNIAFIKSKFNLITSATIGLRRPDPSYYLKRTALFQSLTDVTDPYQDLISHVMIGINITFLLLTFLLIAPFRFHLQYAMTTF